MVIVYRIPVDLDPEVRAAFEGYGVRLLPGDEVVCQAGENPVVTRELDAEIIPLLRSLPVVYAEHASPRRRQRRRAGDRPAWLRIVRDESA